MPMEATAATRALSRRLYGGAQYRIEVGAALARSRLASTIDIAEQLEIPRQTVHQELRALEQAGLVSRTPLDAGRKVFYVAHDSSYWEWCAEAQAHAKEMIERAPRF